MIAQCGENREDTNALRERKVTDVERRRQSNGVKRTSRHQQSVQILLAATFALISQCIEPDQGCAECRAIRFETEPERWQFNLVLYRSSRRATLRLELEEESRTWNVWLLYFYFLVFRGSRGSKRRVHLPLE